MGALTVVYLISVMLAIMFLGIVYNKNEMTSRKRLGLGIIWLPIVTCKAVKLILEGIWDSGKFLVKCIKGE